MGILDRILGRKKTAKQGPAVEVPPCPHLVLVPRWDAAADIGIEDRSTSYTCEACGETYDPATARQMRETTAERLRLGESKTDSST